MNVEKMVLTQDGDVKVIEVFGEPISYGGQEAFVFNVLQNIDMTNLKIDLCTPYYCDNLKFRQLIESTGGTVYCGGTEFLPGKSRSYYLTFFMDFFSNHKYDIVHIHSGSCTALGYIAYTARKKGIKKIILHSHSTGIRYNIKHRIIKAYAGLFMNSGTDYFACSREAGKWKYSKYICKRKLKIIKNGIDLEKYEYNSKIRTIMRLKLGINEDEILLGNVGRLSYEKNQAFLIDIMQGLVDNSVNVKLLLIGEGEDEDKLKSLIRTHHLNNNVIMVGRVDNVNEYMQAMDIFVLPSRYEGLGIVAIEAQAAGLYVLASDTIPRDIELTDDVEFLNLYDKTLWINKICGFSGRDRISRIKNLREAGYDVSETAGIIRQVYFS